MSQPANSSPSVSGRRMVLGMFAFGALATATLWVYWHFHMMPFMPLQEALVEEFGKDSAPRVEGGQRKIHKDSTQMLRVVLRVPFNPQSDTPEVTAEIERHLIIVRDTAADHVNLDDYEILELHLFQQVEEDAYPRVTLRRNLKSWQPVNEDGSPVESTAQSGNAGDQ